MDRIGTKGGRRKEEGGKMGGRGKMGFNWTVWASQTFYAIFFKFRQRSRSYKTKKGTFFKVYISFKQRKSKNKKKYKIDFWKTRSKKSFLVQTICTLHSISNCVLYISSLLSSNSTLVIHSSIRQHRSEQRRQFVVVILTRSRILKMAQSCLVKLAKYNKVGEKFIVLTNT